MKVASAPWARASSISRRAARGVALLDAEPYAETMVDSEKVVTVSIDAASMPRMLPTESAPIRAARPTGMRNFRNAPANAVMMPRAPYRVERNHIRLVTLLAASLSRVSMGYFLGSSTINSTVGCRGHVKGRVMPGPRQMPPLRAASVYGFYERTLSRN